MTVDRLPALSASDLDGRVAVVTGASRGIGAAVARQLAAAGATTILVARSRDAIESGAAEIQAAGGQASTYAVDLTDRAALAELADEIRSAHGRLDILINNAGVLPKARRIERYGWEDWDAVMALNLAGPWYLASRAKELMTRGGVIVNVASTAAFYPSVGLGVYNVSKAAVLMLTRASALEWASANVRVVAVAPGLTDTEMAVPLTAYYESQQLPPNPMDRMAAPEEVADLIVFLASDRASFITGSVFTIDGGELIGLAAH